MGEGGARGLEKNSVVKSAFIDVGMKMGSWTQKSPTAF